MEGCRLLPAVHRCLRLLRIWRLPGWCLVQRRLAATPAATQALHTVAGAIRHSGSSSHLGPFPDWTAHQVSLRQPAHRAWTNQSSRHPGIMDLLRTLFFIAARNNFTVSLVHLPGRLNCIADALSRNQMSRFFSLAPQANQLPTPVPQELAEL